MLNRGIVTDNRPAAIAALKRIGYYPLSAYTYPFREPPTDEDVSSGRTRAKTFRPGTAIEDALKLYEFDRKLRVILLQALQEIEVSLATKIGYVLGKRNGSGHLLISELDTVKCSVISAEGITAHEKWVNRYEKLRSDAREEEYIKHHVLHYGGDIPIWVATGFMDFGCLIRLYSLMDKTDKLRIASEFGLKSNASETLHRWLRALNILRNNCAHNNRVWNRATVDVPPKFASQVAPSYLEHLNQLPNDQRQKVYLLIALTGHLIRAIDPSSSWTWSSLPTQAKKLGNVGGMTLENTMGFPVGWEKLELWQRVN